MASTFSVPDFSVEEMMEASALPKEQKQTKNLADPLHYSKPSTMATVRCFTPPCERRSLHVRRVANAEVSLPEEEAQDSKLEEEGIEIPIVVVSEVNKECDKSADGKASMLSLPKEELHEAILEEEGIEIPIFVVSEANEECDEEADVKAAPTLSLRKEELHEAKPEEERTKIPDVVVSEADGEYNDGKVSTLSLPKKELHEAMPEEEEGIEIPIFVVSEANEECDEEADVKAAPTFSLRKEELNEAKPEEERTKIPDVVVSEADGEYDDGKVSTLSLPKKELHEAMPEEEDRNQIADDFVSEANEECDEAADIKASVPSLLKDEAMPEKERTEIPGVVVSEANEEYDEEAADGKASTLSLPKEDRHEAMPEEEQNIKIPIVVVSETNEECDEVADAKASNRRAKRMIGRGLMKIWAGRKVKGVPLHPFPKRVKKEMTGMNRETESDLIVKDEGFESSDLPSMLPKVSVLTDYRTEELPSQREKMDATISTRTTVSDPVIEEPGRNVSQVSADTGMGHKNAAVSKLSSLLVTVSTKLKKDCETTDAGGHGIPSMYPSITVKEFHSARQKALQEPRKKSLRSRLSLVVSSVSSRTLSAVSRCTPVPNVPCHSAKDTVSEFTIDSSESDESVDSEDVSVTLSIASHLSMLVAEHEGEIDNELTNHVDLIVAKFGRYQVQKGIKARIREVGIANFVTAELQKKAEGIVDEVDVCQFLCGDPEGVSAACSIDAFNDLVAFGSISKPEIWAENFKAAGVALGYVADDADSEKSAQKDNDCLASASNDDDIFDVVHMREAALIDGLYFIGDNDSTSQQASNGSDNDSISLQGSNGSFKEALDECNDIDMAMDLLVDRAARQGVGEVGLLEKLWAVSNV